MSNEHELPSDSDDSDEDYVPDGAETEVVSEVESDGDAESGPEDENDENVSESKKRGAKGKKRGKSNNTKRKKMKVADSKDKTDETEEKETGEQKQLTEEEEQKRVDSLWADFMKDASVPTRPKSTGSINSSRKSIPSTLDTSKPKAAETVKITKLFEFAGEEVRVEKEVPADCAEARLVLPSAKDTPTPTSTVAKIQPKTTTPRRGGLGGISSVLGQLGKKAKISTLEKSKLDWDSYKKQENIEEEILTHNKGKDGYLERQDFLQRSDLRQFELEKQMRSSRRAR